MRHRSAEITACRPSSLNLCLKGLDFVVPAIGVLGEHHVGARLGEAERDGPADALRSAGDDRALVLQAEARVVSHDSLAVLPPASFRLKPEATNRGSHNHRKVASAFRRKDA